MVEADGVGWREAVFTRLKPVTRQGSATVWTVPRDATAQLLEELAKCPATKILQAPKVTALSGVPATIQCRPNRPLVTQVAWNGAGSGKRRYAPRSSGRLAHDDDRPKLDQGILVQVVFEDTVIRAVHHVNVIDSPTVSGFVDCGQRRAPGVPVPKRGRGCMAIAGMRIP